MLKMRRKLRGEEGASLVEFALIAPILFLILFGLIDFGFIYNDFLSVRQGVRDGARAGAVANFGTQTDCGNGGGAAGTFTAGITSQQALKLICTTRNRIGLDTDRMRIAICLSSLTTAGTCSNSAVNDYKDGNSLVVCAMYPAQSRSGFLKPFLGNGVVTTRVSIRIEQTNYEINGSQGTNSDDLASAQESLAGTSSFPGGKNWNFCVP
jgi:Flp pilus assembly protein TadG